MTSIHLTSLRGCGFLRSRNADVGVGVVRRCCENGKPEKPPEVRLREQVEKVIAAIRPAIQADQGDIVLVEVDEATGVVTVELQGACVTCPASTQTLKSGIERIMKDRVDGVTEVVEINELGMSEAAVSL